MKTFIVRWNDGKEETVQGGDKADALQRAGIGADAISDIDCIKEILGCRQITPEDCKAPEGQLRIIREHMDDASAGELEIVCDIHSKQSVAKVILLSLQVEYEDDVFTMWDDHGKEIVPDFT